jgi:hypothetical protein
MFDIILSVLEIAKNVDFLKQKVGNRRLCICVPGYQFRGKHINIYSDNEHHHLTVLYHLHAQRSTVVL